MKQLYGPLLYYSAAMLSIYMTYAMTQSMAPALPDFFGTEPVAKSLRLWLCTNSLVAAGFLTFAAGERFCPPAWKKFLPIMVMALGAAASFVITAATGAVWALALMALLLPVGYLTSGAHYVLAMQVPANWRGRFLGLAITITVLIQYGLFTDGKGVAPPLMAAVFAVTGALSCYTLRDRTALQSVKNDDERIPPPAPQYVAMLFLLISLLAALHGCGDSLALAFYANVDESIFHDSIRLFLPLGMLVAGCVADYRERHYLLSVTAIGLLLRIVSLFALSTSAGFIFSQSMEYFISSFCIMCYTLYFLDLAGKTANPTLWAGMGRTLALPISALSANIFYFMNSFSYGFMTTYVLVLALLNLFFYHGSFREWLEIPESSPAAPPEYAAPLPVTGHIAATEAVAVLPEPPTLSDWQEKFAFTPREMEVLKEVLTEKTAAEIATELGIKERTVRYHIANLLKKTGTSHRAELKLLLSLPIDVRE